jgi:hypothetical protein
MSTTATAPLDDGYYEHGIEARHTAARTLSAMSPRYSTTSKTEPTGFSPSYSI